MSEFVKGDYVKLKIGGPAMIIDDFCNKDDIRCVWFDGKKHKAAFFREHTIRKITVEDAVDFDKEAK